jgi:2,3-bisphosphoglycerate-dependent phosphoglycerate mutase
MKPLLFWLGLFVSLSIASAQPFLVIVRHAEKANSDKDPDLSAAGQARADMLAKLLKDSGIVAVFTTEYRRTVETAAPTARALGVSPTVVPADDKDQLVERLRALKGNALVVGHGNTIPDLIKRFGIETPVNIPENDYTEIFVVTLGDKSQLLHLHYPGDLTAFRGYNIKLETSPGK